MACAPEPSDRWWRVAVAVGAVAWGGNQFTPLLVMYRADARMSAVTVDVLLGAYVLGIVPALLVGGPLSDRYGRRPLLAPAPVLGVVGSALLAVGEHSAATLAAGRVCSGLALGLAMAVGTSWVKELSGPGAGARRASVALTAGFGLGAAVAAALAQWAPWRGSLPYLVNIVVTLAALGALLGAPETRGRASAPGRLVDDLRIPSAGHRRFLTVVAPTAPWVFGCAASAYAILPALLGAQVRGESIGFSGLMCLVALGSGVAVQQWAGPRADDPGSSRGLSTGMVAVVPGMVLAAVVAHTRDPWLALLASAVLGVGYGLLLVCGLAEVQRIAGPDDLAGLTAVYYSIAYLGFFVPAVLAVLAAELSYVQAFVAGGVLAAISLVLTVAGRHRALPGPGREPVGS